MPELAAATATQADDAAKSQADDKAKPETKSQADNGKSQADESISLEEAKKLRKEAQKLRQRLEEAESKNKAAEDEKLSETERLKKQLKEAEDEKVKWATERRDRDARDEVIGELSDERDDNPYKSRNPRAVYKLVKDDLEFDDKGQISNLSQVLKQAKKDYPELFGRVSGSADGGKGARDKAGGFDMNAAIRKAAGRE